MRRSLVALVFCVPLGCGADVPGPQPTPDPSSLYWALTLDQHAITLDTLPPYDTVRLTATARTVAGTPLEGLPPVTYTSTDLEHARVSADGLVQALAPGTQIAVVATLTAGPLTHADTVMLNVTASPTPPQPAATFALTADSARWEANGIEGTIYGLALFGATAVRAQVLDDALTPIPGALADYRSSDPEIAVIARARGTVDGKAPGQVLLTASATVYGVRQADTLPFTITAPLSAVTSPGRPYLGATSWAFVPSDITIEEGGVVAWRAPNFEQPAPALQLDVVFDDPTQALDDALFCEPYSFFGLVCGGGDIAVFGDTASDVISDFIANYRTRQFRVPGTYAFHSPLLHASGTIHVVHTPGPSLRVMKSREF